MTVLKSFVRPDDNYRIVIEQMETKSGEKTDDVWLWVSTAEGEERCVEQYSTDEHRAAAKAYGGFAVLQRSCPVTLRLIWQHGVFERHSIQ